MGSESFHKGKYYVTFKRGFEDCKKDITITVYKVFENDSLRIVLSDEEDPTFLCVLIVTRCDYEDLKKQQGLLIDFDNFPAQLVRLLQQCLTNNMFLIMHQANPVQFFFEVIEHNEFKRLVHLSLKTAPANDTDIKKHMADTIANLKNALLSIKGSLSSSEALWSDKCIAMERKIHELTLAVSRMEEERRRAETECQETLRQEKEKLAQERIQLQRSSELSAKSQMASVQESLSRKDKQIDELSSVIKQQKENISQLENRLSDKNQRLTMLENEVQKAHIEVATTKARSTTLEREVLDKEKQTHQIQLKCMDLEKTVKDNSEIIKELNGSLKMLTKEKISLQERLAISESLSNRKNEAANSTTEQLMKANQIISKQNSDLIEMKEKMLCRTAIAIEQEKVIETNAKEMEDLKTQLKETRQNFDTLRQELESLKVKHESSEKALLDKEEMIKNNNLVIQWLHKKMEDNQLSASQSRHNPAHLPASSSTPYFLSNRNVSDNLNSHSDESINFYATSKLSDAEDSAGPEVQPSSPKPGLDPKYLKPADDGKRLKSATSKGSGAKTTAEVVNQKGKENKNVNLPKVDYREKKSSRPVTYRSTPVSAYFP